MAKRVLATVLLLIVTSVAVAAKPQSGAAPGKIAALDTSLRIVPESAAFYSAAFRMRQQLQTVLASRAWKALGELPVVQMAKTFYLMQAASPETPVGKFQQILSDPQVQAALALLGDMLSNEAFVYGDASTLDFLELLQEIQGGNQLAQFLSLREENKAEQSKAQAKMVLGLLAENVDRVKVPNLVLGFRVQNTQRAVEQLAKLELILGVVLEQEARTKGALKRTTVAGRDYLVLTLNGQMIPWDEVPLGEIKEQVDEPKQIDKLVAQLKKQKLVLTLGLRDKYLIVAVGPSTEAVAALGQGKALAERPEWKRLDPIAGKPITSLSYMTGATAERVRTNQANVDAVRQAADELLPLAKLSEEQEKRIGKDLQALADDFAGLLPDLGPVVSASYLVPQGTEHYGYQWAERLGPATTKPLSLLAHLGGNPLVAMVGRGNFSGEGYDLLVKWLRVGWGYVETLGVPRMPAKDRKEFQKFVELARPLLRRIDEVNRTMLIPALADGQVGMVFDGKLRSKQFLRDLPATEKPMPMIEPALVLGVSDPALLRKAAGEYVKFVQGILDAARKTSPDEVPVLKLPKPKLSKTEHGELAVYALPAEWGVDKQVALAFGLADKVAVVAATPKHAERLLAPTPLAVGGVLADPERPRVAVVAVRWAGLVDFAAPWIELAVRSFAGEQQQAILVQVQPVYDLLKVLRSSTIEQYREANVVVGHGRTEIRDLPPPKK